MATQAKGAGGAQAKVAKPLAPDGYERFLAYAAIILLVTILLALAKGQPHWPHVPLVIWAHLAAVLVALALTPVMLLRRRGDRRHRLLGKVWVVAMWLTALISLWLRYSQQGNFSVIHILSAYVLVAAPLIWWSARRHQVAAHRAQVRGMVTGALLIAGFFTFPFGRMMGSWLFG